MCSYILQIPVFCCVRSTDVLKPVDLTFNALILNKSWQNRNHGAKCSAGCISFGQSYPRLIMVSLIILRVRIVNQHIKLMNSQFKNSPNTVGVIILQTIRLTWSTNGGTLCVCVCVCLCVRVFVCVFVCACVCVCIYT
jgi:hypothetical protein